MGIKDILIHCTVQHHQCDEEECYANQMSGKSGTIEVKSIDELIHADYDEEFPFTSSGDNPDTVWLLKENLIFKMPIFGE